MTVGMDRRIERAVWRRRPVQIAAGAVVVVAAGVLLALAMNGAASSVRVPAATVTIDEVQSGVFHDFVPLKGKASPKDEVYLDALDGGQVAEVLARSGDQVVVGQPLVKFRNTALELDVLDR
jgi:HlyD family secretion protein